MAKTTTAGTSTDAQTENGAAASDAGVKEIPIGMSVSDMKASNEPVVLQIEEQGKKAGQEEERKRISELQAAFPNDAAFVAEATEKGWSVTEAKAAKFDAAIAENVELKKKNAELTEATKEPVLEFAASDGEKKKVATEDDSVDAMDAKSIKLWEKDPALQARFNGNKGAFQAYYRNDPEGASALCSKK